MNFCCCLLLFLKIPLNMKICINNLINNPFLCFYRAFHAWEEKALIDRDAEHQERQLLQENKEKLIIGSDVIPDIFTIKTGWQKEDEEGLTKCPSVYFTDISDYLKTKTSSELMSHLINEYKEGKAYRYYTTGWVQEVFYHKISDNPLLPIKVPCHPFSKNLHKTIPCLGCDRKRY